MRETGRCSPWSLEAGALVLADRGIACVDEIDKIHPEAVSSMHDALESQKVRVNKAGINATLSARTSLMAAGNPENGRFDAYQPKAQQIDLSPTLLSRFDLMFMVSDTPDAERHRDVVDHMRRGRRASAKHARDEELTEEERDSIEPAIHRDVLRAYITHAKETCQPVLRDSDAEEHLREEFLRFRMANKEDGDNPVPVTFRQVGANERLAEASARVRLSNEVSRSDVDRAVGLVRESMKQVGIDPETGEFDADIIETGQPKSQRDRRRNLLAMIEELEGATIHKLHEIADMDRVRLEEDVQSLLDRGEIFELDGVLRTV